MYIRRIVFAVDIKTIPLFRLLTTPKQLRHGDKTKSKINNIELLLTDRAVLSSNN